MKVNIKTISEKTGFSPSTVSNALNHKKGVNAETAAEIFRVAKELGYTSGRDIGKIKFVIFKRNGLIIDDTPFFSLLIEGVEQECKKYGMEMVICNLNYNDLDYEKQVDQLIHDNSSAVILLGTELMEEDVEIYKSATCPFLMLDYWAWDMSFNGVLINNADSARVAVEYLIRKGHKDIGYLQGRFRIKAFRSRCVGYKIAMEKAGLEVRDDNMIVLATTLNGAYKDMLAKLDEMDHMPTAFYADNDMIALGAMKALQEKGYRIPDDVSIIGFDDLPFSEISSPPLTTLRVPKREMGQLAVKRLMDEINGDRIKTKNQVCTVFVERGSVKSFEITS